jgi:quinol monooxygenase YgiN
MRDELADHRIGTREEWQAARERLLEREREHTRLGDELARQRRESYLADCVRIVEQARRAVGCLDVAICADLIDPGRVNIFERWESQAALETLRSSGPDTEQRPAMLAVSVQEYDIADVRPVFGKEAE